MVSIQKVDNAIRFTFENSSFYLYNDGTVNVPLNALTLVLDEADMANFVKASSNDNLFSIPMSELSQFADKAALQSWFEENAYGGGGITPEEVAEMIDEAVAPVEDDIETIADDINEKEEVVARALTDLHENKQDKLTAGSGITISGNVISAEGGVVVDPTLDSGSTNPVANSAITAGIAEKVDNIRTITSVDTNNKPIGIINQQKGNSGTGKALFGSINGVRILQGNDIYNVNHFSLVETSAITTSMTSSSTNAQVPSAKAVYDELQAKQGTLTAGSGISIANDVISVTGGGGSVTVDPALDSGSTNPVANSAITQAIDAKQDLLYNYTEDINEAKITFEADGLTTGETTFNSTGIDVYSLNDDSVYKTEAALTVLTGATQLYYSNYSYGDDASTQTGNFEFSTAENGLWVSVVDENGQTDFRVEPSGATINDDAIVTDSRLDGLSFVRCTQAEYDALVQGGTVDADTLYVITNVV